MATDRNVVDPDPVQYVLEGALDEVLASIQSGSALPLTDAARDALRQRYEPDFEESLLSGVDWQKARQRILPLARLVGNLATTLAVLKAQREDRPLPEAVDEESALQASDLVAAMKFCPPSDKEVHEPRGNFCKLRHGTSHDEAATALRAFLGHLGTLDHLLS